MKQTRCNLLGPALLMALAMWAGLWRIGKAIDGIRINVSIPQVKTTVQLPEKRGEFYLPPAVQK